MHVFYLIIARSGISLNTRTKGYRQDWKIGQMYVRQGDLLEITNDGYYAQGEGWFIKAVINQQLPVYIAFADLEKCLFQREMALIADLQMKFIIWEYQLNQALEQRNEDWFKFIARKISSLHEVV